MSGPGPMQGPASASPHPAAQCTEATLRGLHCSGRAAPPRPPASQPPHTMLSAELYIAAGNILQLEYFRRKILRSNEEYVLKPKPPVKMFMHNNCSFVNKLLDVEERYFSACILSSLSCDLFHTESVITTTQ